LSRKRLQPDLDLTPLIDVLFMLILFFVLSASLLQGQISVRLPSGQGNALRGRPVVLEIRPDGKLRYDGKEVDAPTAIERARRETSGGRELVIAADRVVPYGRVAAILESLRSAGVTDVGLALEGGKSP
jgi:biopolymer transport protein TolR